MRGSDGGSQSSLETLIHADLRLSKAGTFCSIPIRQFAEGDSMPPTVTRAQRAAAEEAERQMRSAKSLQELFAAFRSTMTTERDDDFLKALDANRSGDRPLFPPELKGVTW